MKRTIIAIAAALPILAIGLGAQADAERRGEGRMIVAYHRGTETVDLEPGDDYTDGSTASIVILTGRDRTFASLRVKGLGDSHEGLQLGWHLHRDACTDGDGGPHYAADPDAPATDHDSHLHFAPTAEGGQFWEIVTTDFAIDMTEPRSIVAHDGTREGNPRVACYDLKLRRSWSSGRYHR